MSNIKISPGISTNISYSEQWHDFYFNPKVKKQIIKKCDKNKKKPCKKVHQYIRAIDKIASHKYPMYNPMYGSYNSYFYFDYQVFPPKPTPRNIIKNHEMWQSTNIIDNKKSIEKSDKNINKNKQNISTNTKDITKNTKNISDNTNSININKQNIASNISNININKQNITKNTNDITDINNVLGSNVWKIFNE